MLRKFILTATFCLTLVVPGYTGTTASAGIEQEYTEVSSSGEQTNVKGDWTDSKEVNTVQESELTRKQIQAEKARNAAENDSMGGAITIIAMTIVVGALVILSVLFMIFGKISSKTLTRKKKAAHGVNDETASDHHEELDSGEVIAAIAAALAEHFGQGHDMEDTILTIKRMRKAYSPWNSKIYNMRHLPAQPSLTSNNRRALK